MAFNAFEAFVKLGVDRKQLDKDMDKVEKDLKKSKIFKDKLLTKIGVDPKEFDKKMDEAHKKVEKLTSAVKKVGSTMGSALGKVGTLALNATTTALKATTAAMGGAVAGVIALAKQSYSAYSEYQQLVGGVQKLYGNMNLSLEEWAEKQGRTLEDARADYERNAEAEAYILEKARNAYATTGMSANKYMDTATQFSASLVSALGGDTLKAAEETDKAMRAISDNWNTFGGDMEAITNAYKGFSKQNFTMLDNLKLGYGGTKTEMERLIADAEAINSNFKAARDENGKYAMSFNDIIDAIDIIQQKQQIAGTTANEASKTISGSFGSLKAAWENLVTGFADPDADLGQLITNVVETAGVALQNAIPTIVQALGGIGQAIEQLAPVIGEQLPPLIEQTLPAILSAASSLVQSIADALPGLVSIINEQLPGILETILPVAISALTTIFQAIGDVLPTLLKIIEENSDALTTGIVSIIGVVGQIILEALPVLIPIAVELLNKLMSALTANLDAVIDGGIQIVTTLADSLLKPENIKALVDGAKTLLLKLMQGFQKIMPKLIPQMVDAFCTLAEALTDPKVLGDLITGALDCILAIVQGLVEAAPRLGQAVITIIGNLIMTIIDKGPEILSQLWTLVEGILTGLFGFVMGLLGSSWEDIQESFSAVFEYIGQFFSDIWDKIGEFFVNIGTSIAGFFTNAWDGITGFFEDVFSGTWLTDIISAIGDFFSGIWEDFTGWIGDIWDGVTGFAGDLIDKAGEIVSDVTGKFMELVAKGATWGKDMIQGIIDGIGGMLSDLWDTVTDVAEGIADFLGFSVPKKGPMSHADKWGPDMVDLIATGIDDEEPKLKDKVRKVAGNIQEGMSDLNISPLKVDAIGVADVQSKVSGTYEVQNSRINDLIEIVRDFMRQGQEIVIPVYIAGKQVDEILVNGKNRITTRSGGMVNV